MEDELTDFEAQAAIPDSLSPFFAELRVLHSAWSVIAPIGVKVAGQNFGETARALGEYVSTLARKERDPNAATLIDLEERMSALATTVREIASQIPTSQLRGSLPDSVGRDRRGVLDLLDLMLDERDSSVKPLSDRMGSIDYLITLLCTGGTGHVIRHDPVTLSPAVNAFCIECEAQAGDDPRIEEIEAEFFTAASLDSEQLQHEISLRQMRQRKAELAHLYFAPKVLRSIVSYNAVLIERMADEVWSSTDWGIDAVPHAADPKTRAASTGSVFAAPALADLADALRRRKEGGTPEPNDVDRVAWCLDLDFATDVELGTLFQPNVGSAENVLGTTILVGLINRSLAVLSSELESIGIDPDLLSDVWIKELSELLQTETNKFLAKDAYQPASALSEIRAKFLLDPFLETPKAPRPLPPRAAPARVRAPAPRSIPTPNLAESQEPRESARDIVREALEEHGSARSRKAQAEKPASSIVQVFQAGGWKIPFAAISVCIVIAFASANLLDSRLLDPDLDSFGAATLAQISPHLDDGYRNGEGAGRAFVGTLKDASWDALSLDARDAEAEKIVSALRAQGINHVMIYDSGDELRIQALGVQPIHSR